MTRFIWWLFTEDGENFIKITLTVAMVALLIWGYRETKEDGS